MRLSFFKFRLTASCFKADKQVIDTSKPLSAKNGGNNNKSFASPKNLVALARNAKLTDNDGSSTSVASSGSFTSGGTGTERSGEDVLLAGSDVASSTCGDSVDVASVATIADDLLIFEDLEDDDDAYFAAATVPAATNPITDDIVSSEIVIVSDVVDVDTTMVVVADESVETVGSTIADVSSEIVSSELPASVSVVNDSIEETDAAVVVVVSSDVDVVPEIVSTSATVSSSVDVDTVPVSTVEIAEEPSLSPSTMVMEIECTGEESNNDAKSPSIANPILPFTGFKKKKKKLGGNSNKALQLAMEEDKHTSHWITMDEEDMDIPEDQPMEMLDSLAFQDSDWDSRPTLVDEVESTVVAEPSSDISKLVVLKHKHMNNVVLKQSEPVPVEEDQVKSNKDVKSPTIVVEEKVDESPISSPVVVETSIESSMDAPVVANPVPRFTGFKKSKKKKLGGNSNKALQLAMEADKHTSQWIIVDEEDMDVPEDQPMEMLDSLAFQDSDWDSRPTLMDEVESTVVAEPSSDIFKLVVLKHKHMKNVVLKKSGPVLPIQDNMVESSADVLVVPVNIEATPLAESDDQGSTAETNDMNDNKKKGSKKKKGANKKNKKKNHRRR